MPESREVEFGVLNISAEPHRDGAYVAMLKRVARHPRQFRGNDFAAITAPEQVEPGLYIGTILIWTELDPDSPAVNKETLEEVKLEDTDIIVPENLGLNSRHFFYAFRGRDHKIFFESKSDDGHHLAPARFKKILDRAFAPINLRGETTVTITVVPDEDGLEKVLSIPKITKLEIYIAPPNPDEGEEHAKSVLKRLKEQGAKDQDIIYNAKSRKSGFKPNNETLLDAKVAAHNGLVRAEGYDTTGHKLPPRSTEEYPKIIPYIIEGAGNVLAGLVRIARQTVIRDRKRRGR